MARRAASPQRPRMMDFHGSLLLGLEGVRFPERLVHADGVALTVIDIGQQEIAEGLELGGPGQRQPRLDLGSDVREGIAGVEQAAGRA